MLVFSVLLDYSIRGQLFLRTNVFDHPRLIRSNLICHRRDTAARWCGVDGGQTHVRSWKHMLDPTTVLHMYIKFIDVSNVQICSVCAEHSLFDRPSIVHQSLGCLYLDLRRQCRKMRVVQMLDSRPEPHAYAELNRASNLQICIVCSDQLPFKLPSFIIFQWRSAQDQNLTEQIWNKEARSWTEIFRRHACVSILCHQREWSLSTTLFNPQNHLGVFGARRGFEKAGGTSWVVPPHRRRLVARIPHWIIFQWSPNCAHWYSSSFSEITFCIACLCAGHPWDLNGYLSCPSQTACIRLVIAHVHPQGDSHQTTPGVAWAASTPSHLMHRGSVPNLHRSLRRSVFFFFNFRVFIKE